MIATGALLVSTCRIASAVLCDISTMMPSRFISAITARPKAVMPPWRGRSVAESTQSNVSLWHSVR